MKRIIGIILVISIVGCSAKKQTISADNQDTNKEGASEITDKSSKGIPMEGAVAFAAIEEDFNNFLQEFEQATLNHNKIKLLELMDSEYKTDQHDGLLGGRTDQFLDEFFAGNQTNGDGFKCLDFDKITNLKRKEVEFDGYIFYVSYIISSKDYEIESGWTITIKETESKYIFGLYGAVG